MSKANVHPTLTENLHIGIDEGTELCRAAGLSESVGGRLQVPSAFRGGGLPHARKLGCVAEPELEELIPHVAVPVYQCSAS
jgi:hypothetical protein